MYLTAQHVRSHDGIDDHQSYLHLHDVPGSEPFPDDRRTVPFEHPGRMVLKGEHILPPGGNDVLSYLDVVAEDAWWHQTVPPGRSSTDWWRYNLAPLGDLIVATGKPLPWAIDVAGLYVVFDTTSWLPPAHEFETLVDVALAVWDRWRVHQGLR
jgi:hypothetical protein